MKSKLPLSEEDILPIDRGWAWVIVAVGSLIFGLTSGGFKIQGIILVELDERHPQIATSDLLWTFTLSTIFYIAGPLFSYLVTKFTHRTVMIGGLILYAVGFIGLAYTTTLTGIILLYSVPAGFGFTAIILMSYLTPTTYFKKKRALALGLVASGSGLGTFILPYIIRGLFDYFTFPEALIYYAGFVLQFVCIACLMRPMSYYEIIHKKEIMLLRSTSEAKNDLEKIDVGNNAYDAEPTLYSQSADGLGQRFKVGDEILSKGSETRLRNGVAAWEFLSMGNLPASLSKDFVETMNDWSVKGSKEYETDTLPVTERDKFVTKIIYHPKMLLFATSIFTYVLGAQIVYQCLPSLAKESGVPKSTVALVFMVVGLLEIPFRAANGYLADKHVVTAYTQFMFGLILAGSAVLVGGLISGLAGVIVALFGMSACGTSIYNLIPIVLAELLGPKNLTTTMGVQMGIQGIGTLLTTFITGRLYDATKSWQLVHVYLASCMITGGVILLPYWIYKKLTLRYVPDDDGSKDTVIETL